MAQLFTWDGCGCLCALVIGSAECIKKLGEVQSVTWCVCAGLLTLHLIVRLDEIVEEIWEDAICCLLT